MNKSFFFDWMRFDLYRRKWIQMAARSVRRGTSLRFREKHKLAASTFSILSVVLCPCLRADEFNNSKRRNNFTLYLPLLPTICVERWWKFCEYCEYVERKAARICQTFAMSDIWVKRCWKCRRNLRAFFNIFFSRIHESFCTEHKRTLTFAAKFLNEKNAKTGEIYESCADRWNPLMLFAVPGSQIE